MCNGQFSTSRCIEIVIMFEQHYVFNIENKGSVYLFQKIGTIIRSGDNSKWQACMRGTDADRSWQAGHGEPWTSKRDERGRSNAWHSCLVTALLSTQEDLVLAHSSERANSDSEGEPKKTKNGSIVLMLTSAKKKRSILRPEKYGDLTKTEHKILNEGCESRNNHRYAFVVQDLATQLRVKPKLHRRRRRIYESSYGRRRSQKVIHTYNVLEFGKYCEELSWNHRTITLYRSETSGTAEGAVRRAQEETSAVFFAIWIGC